MGEDGAGKHAGHVVQSLGTLGLSRVSALQVRPGQGCSDEFLAGWPGAGICAAWFCMAVSDCLHLLYGSMYCSPGKHGAFYVDHIISLHMVVF